jgi:hypothetical protein
MEIETGKKKPVFITKHHTSTELHELHEKLATLHRTHEQRVNYFKAKVKNIVTKENARIAKINADAQHKSEKINKENFAAWEIAYNMVQDQVMTIQNDFEIKRETRIAAIALLRIEIDPRYQVIVDKYLVKSQPKK